MLATLSEARHSALRNIAGACNNSPEFLQLLNDATRQLMRRGDWAGTVQPTYMCVKRGCLTLPRYVGTVRQMNWCGQQPVDIHGLWWKFLSKEYYQQFCGSHRHQRSDCHMIAQGHASVHTDILGTGRTVRAYAESRMDVDQAKTVTIFGLDNDQQPLKTRMGDGTWAPGIILTVADPFGSTNTFISRIDRVLKDETNGIIRLYAYDAANDVLEDLATYEPSETNPDYVRYRLSAPICGAGGCGTAQAVTALVKLKFIEAKLDTDLVLIQNLDALKDMMQAIKFKEAGDLNSARAFEASAIRELNLELADELPNGQIPVSVQPFNGITFSNQTF